MMSLAKPVDAPRATEPVFQTGPSRNREVGPRKRSRRESSNRRLDHHADEPKPAPS